MKPLWQSVTFWSLVATLVGLALAGIGEGKSAGEILSDDIVRETIGEVLAAMGLAGVAWGRARAQGPLSLGRKDDESGRAGLPLLAALVALALVPLLLSLAACGAMQVQAERDIDVDIDVGPPCVVVVRADGEIVSTTRGPKPCKVVVPPAPKPRPET